MTVPTNTFITGDAIGNRESLHDIIFMTDKAETPFVSLIDSGTAKAVTEEWQTDDLGSANATNAHLEGDDTDAVAVVATTRVGNKTQIMKRPFFIARTQESVDHAGRGSEINYQAVLAGKRLRIDVETIFLRNQASVAQSAPTTRKLGGAPSWYTSNVSRGSGGNSGGFQSGNTVAATNGTQRVFTEDLMKSVMKSAWDNGGKPDTLLLGSFNKQAFSGFTGVATQFKNVTGKAATLVGAVDRYESDFGTINAVPDRYCAARDAHLIDTDRWRALWLDKIKKEELAKTGDARKFHMICEVTLECSNQMASGIIADLTTS